MTKLEIIDDTVAFYSADVSRRSINQVETGKVHCVYKGPEGRECGFQRVVEDDLSGFDRPTIMGVGVSAMVVMSRIANLKFKPGYEGHEADFWVDIQRLHDHSDNWDAYGLTSVGKDYVEKIKYLWKDK